MEKVIMAVEATAEEAMVAMGSEAEVEVEVSQDPTDLIAKVLHRAVAQIGSHPTQEDEEDPIPTTMVVVDKVPREATVRDEAKAKDVHHLHKVAQVPMPIDKEIKQTDHQMEGHREVHKVAAIGTKVKARDRTIRTVTRTVTRIKVAEGKANKIKVRTTKARTTTRGKTTTIIKARTTITTKGKTKTEIEVKASRTKVSKTRATRGKDRHKTRGSFRTTTTTIITIIIMATSPSQKSLSLRRRPRSRPQRPSRLQPPPLTPNRQNNRLLLLLRLPQQKRRLSLLNHRQHWLRRHRPLNKPQHLRL